MSTYSPRFVLRVLAVACLGAACGGGEPEPYPFQSDGRDGPFTKSPTDPPVTEAGGGATETPAKDDPSGPTSTPVPPPGETPQPSEERSPVVTALSPDSVALGLVPPEGLEITVGGSNFVDGATVQVGDYLLGATFKTAKEVRVKLSADRLRNVGDYRVTVTNPSGRASNPLSFTVATPGSVGIARLTPGQAIAYQAAPVTIQLSGDGFLQASQVRFDGEALATTYVSASSVSAVIPPQLLTSAGRHALTVANGTAVVSAPVGFDVNNPAPGITGFNPPAAAFNTGVVQITVFGAGFTPETTVRFANFPTAQPTTFVSPTEIRFALDTRIRGFYSLSVVTPLPGGGGTPLVNYYVN